MRLVSPNGIPVNQCITIPTIHRYKALTGLIHFVPKLHIHIMNMYPVAPWEIIARWLPLHLASLMTTKLKQPRHYEMQTVAATMRYEMGRAIIMFKHHHKITGNLSQVQYIQSFIDHQKNYLYQIHQRLRSVICSLLLNHIDLHVKSQ